jgi:uncharacterized protein GlcG (DUF336 family)
MKWKLIAAVTTALALAVCAYAPVPSVDAQDGFSGSDITLDAAMRVVDAARKKAADIDTKMDIAVVDAGGNLKAFVRMDGAWLGSIDIAQKKAKTARFFDMNTGAIGELSQPGGPLYQIEVSNDGLITFPGGVPLKNDDGDVIGAIGVSGSSVENDHTVAQAGADALELMELAMWGTFSFLKEMVPHTPPEETFSVAGLPTAPLRATEGLQSLDVAPWTRVVPCAF